MSRQRASPISLASSFFAVMLKMKLVALIATTVFLPVILVSFIAMLSLPKPTWLEWWYVPQSALVLHSVALEGEGIFLTLQLPDVIEPRLYVVPWNRNIAEQLQKAQREAAQNHSRGVEMHLPFEPSLNDEVERFHVLPQPKLRSKDDRRPNGREEEA